MLSHSFPSDTEALQRIISEQAKKIENLEHQLKQNNRDASTDTTSGSSVMVVNAASPVRHIKTEQEEETKLPAVSSPSLRRSARLKKSTPPAESHLVSSSASKKTLKKASPHDMFHLNDFPSKNTFDGEIKRALEQHGYDQDAHLQSLINEDSKLPSSNRSVRWHLAFRFCSHLVLFNTKISAHTLFHGDKQINKDLSLDSFPGLRALFKSTLNIYCASLEKPLGAAAALFLSNRKHRREIIKFMYAFCSLLYVFLPQRITIDQVRNQHSAIVKVVAEEEQKSS